VADLRAAALAFFATALASFITIRAIPFAQACIASAPWDTAGTFDLQLGSVHETTGTGAPVADEQATWASTATVSMTEHRLDLADGTHLEWR
jgi:hypothetical protein